MPGGVARDTPSRCHVRVTVSPTLKVRVSRSTIWVSDLPDFDVGLLLDSEQPIVTYLNGIIQARDTALLVSALVDLARARGIASFAGAAGITRHALGRSSLPGARPSFQTVSRLCRALGLNLAFECGN